MIISNREKIFYREQVKRALEKHSTCEEASKYLGCCPKTTNRLIDRLFPDLKPLARRKDESNKGWDY